MQLKKTGGIERYISTLAEMLSKHYEVEIICNYGKLSNKLAFPLPKNVKVTFLTTNQPAEISMKNLLLHLKWHKIPSELKRRININKTRNSVFRKKLSNLQTDFIITERALYSSLINKYYYGSAIKIATDHNYHQNQHKYINELAKSIQSFNYLILPTTELKNFYAPKFPNLKCLCIPPALENIPRQKSKLKTHNLLSVGRLVPDKDFATLINAMSIIHNQLPDAKLTIIGDGPEKQSLVTQIHHLGLNHVVSIIGPLSHEEMAPYYYDSSLFLSTSKTEAFGLAIAEAMSYGLPCIALKRASGARAQINPSCGELVDTVDPAIFAHYVVKLMDNPTKLTQFQTHINSEIQKYSKENIFKSWQKIL